MIENFGLPPIDLSKLVAYRENKPYSKNRIKRQLTRLRKAVAQNTVTEAHLLALLAALPDAALVGGTTPLALRAWVDGAVIDHAKQAPRLPEPVFLHDTERGIDDFDLVLYPDNVVLWANLRVVLSQMFETAAFLREARPKSFPRVYVAPSTLGAAGVELAYRMNRETAAGKNVADWLLYEASIDRLRGVNAIPHVRLLMYAVQQCAAHPEGEAGHIVAVTYEQVAREVVEILLADFTPSRNKKG